MSAFTIAGKIYITEEAIESVSLDEVYPGREKAWFEGHTGENCTIYKSKKGQWFMIIARVFNYLSPEVRLITPQEAVVLMLSHDKKNEAIRIFGESALEEMAG